MLELFLKQLLLTVQGLVSKALPWQRLGTEQMRLRIINPWPQLTEQRDQSVHSDQVIDAFSARLLPPQSLSLLVLNLILSTVISPPFSSVMSASKIIKNPGISTLNSVLA